MRSTHFETRTRGRLGPWKIYKFGHGLTLVPERRSVSLGQAGATGDWSQTIGAKDLDFILQLNIQTWYPHTSTYKRMALINGHSSIHVVAVDHRQAAHLFWLPEQGISEPKILSSLKHRSELGCSTEQVNRYCLSKLESFWNNGPVAVQPHTLKRLGGHIAERCHTTQCSTRSAKRIHLHVLAHDLQSVLEQHSETLRRIELSGARVSTWEWAINLSDWGGRLALRELKLAQAVAINELPDISLKSAAFQETTWSCAEELLNAN